MTFSKEQIIALENPYQELGNGDTLAEHQEKLDTLSPEEQRTIACAILLECPDKELNQLRHAIEALRHPANTESSFHSVIARVFEIRKRIEGLKDKRNRHPHLSLLNNELPRELFHEFPDYSLQLLNTHETAIALKLALTTPKNQCSELIRSIQNTFPDSVLATQVSTAFTIRRAIDQYLLGEHPESFFSSSDINPQSCVPFNPLFQLIADKHEDIAQKFACTVGAGQRPRLLEKMKQIMPQNELITRTQAAFNAQVKTPIVSDQSMFQPADASPAIIDSAPGMKAQ